MDLQKMRNHKKATNHLATNPMNTGIRYGLAEELRVETGEENFVTRLVKESFLHENPDEYLLSRREELKNHEHTA
jgi:hypothetical protein